MKLLIDRTVEAMTPRSFLPQLALGSLISASYLLLLLLYWPGVKNPQLGGAILMLVWLNTLLYPFARFVYSTIFYLLLGSGPYVVSSFWIFVAQVLITLGCWIFACIITPLAWIFNKLSSMAKFRESLFTKSLRVDYFWFKSIYSMR